MNTFFEILGLQADINWPDFIKLVLRFILNFSFAVIVIKICYSRLYKNKTYEFTYYMFNIITFCICILMRKVPASLGFALAIFAVFGVLRYRTEQIRIKDLTYMFIVIGIGIINAIAYKNISLWELLFVDVAITGFTVFYEIGPFAEHESTMPMMYDRVDLLKPENREKLYGDIEQRTGLRVRRVDVEKMDFLRDSSQIILFYEARPLPDHEDH
jgi:hypothetical protein